MVVIGQEKGSDTNSRIEHNFGMARPEGYRKAQRLMGLANRFGLPVVTLIDSAGAYPGIGAEERGQAEAIARSIETCLGLKVPLVCAIIGDEECLGHRGFRLQAAEVCSAATGSVIVIRAPSPALAASIVPPMSWTMP